MTHLCIPFTESLDLLKLPRHAAFGVAVDCEDCSGVWTRSDREWWTRKLASAQRLLERYLRHPLCAKAIFNEPHYVTCEELLAHAPIAYLGVEEIFEIGEYPINYCRASKVCGTALPGDCEDADDLIGYIQFDLPAGVTADQLRFDYVDREVWETPLVLPQPMLEFPLCGTPAPEPDIQAVWRRSSLIHPHCDTAKLTSMDCFIEGVLVSYVAINEELAVQAAGECDCSCAACTSSDCEAEDLTYSAEIGDALRGTVCITVETGSNCCGKRRLVYVNYGTCLEPYASRHWPHGHGHGTPHGESVESFEHVAEDLAEAVVLLALLQSGRKSLCSCKTHDEAVAYWLEQDPDSQKPLVTPAMLPFGGTRAGMQIARIVQQIIAEPQYHEHSAISGLYKAGTRSSDWRRALGKEW